MLNRSTCSAILDEQALRFNLRKGTDADRFNFVVGQIVGRRLTYADLTASAYGERLN